MFKELLPILRHRVVLMTITTTGEDEIRVNVVPKKLKDDENNALTTPLSVTGTAGQLDSELATTLVEFVGSHLQLKNTLEQAQADMKAAAAAAQAEVREKQKNGKKTTTTSASATASSSTTKPQSATAKPADPVAPPPPRTASLFAPAPAPTTAPAPIPTPVTPAPQAEVSLLNEPDEEEIPAGETPEPEEDEFPEAA